MWSLPVFWNWGRVQQRGVGSLSRRFDFRLGRVDHAAMDDSVNMGSLLINARAMSRSPVKT
jgi:hypothetical protein